jgi:hypothetical protein
MSADPFKVCSKAELRRFALCYINCDRSTVSSHSLLQLKRHIILFPLCLPR